MSSLLSSTITASQIHYVGLRDIDPAEQDRIDQDTIYAPVTLSVDHLIDTLTSKNITHIYIHFDVDGLDPNAYDQTYYQVPNGLTIEESEICIRALQQHFTVVGSSVLESIATETSALKPIETILNLLLK